MSSLFPRFGASPETLRTLGVNTRGSGLIIGETDSGQAASVDLLRATPTRAVLLGSLTLAQTFVFRALGLGSSVAVSTWRQQPWQELGRRAEAGSALVVTGADQLDPAEGSESAPMLVVQDSGSVPQEARVAPAPWRTTLHVLGGLHPLTQPILAAADLLFLQRLDRSQAEALGALLQLQPRLVDQLSSMRPLQIAALSRAGGQLVNLVSSPTETRILQR